MYQLLRKEVLVDSIANAYRDCETREAQYEHNRERPFWRHLFIICHFSDLPVYKPGFQKDAGQQDASKYAHSQKID